MEEKNELNDIILNKSGSGASSKKLLLAIAALTLILIIVLVVMNSLKTQNDEQAPHAAVPPEPSAPTEIIDDPLFEPVEVIQEGGNESAPQDLGQIAQKIKQESFQNSPVPETTVQTAPPVAAQPSMPVSQPAPVALTTPKPEPKAVIKPTPVVTKVQAAPAVTKTQAAPVATKVQAAPAAAQPIINTPTIKTVKTEPKKVAAPAIQKPKPVEKAAETVVEKPIEKTRTEIASKAADTEGTYYIQVGSFTKQPNQALFDRLNASGLKYITTPSGAATKIMVGPFQGKKAAYDVLGTVKRNIEAGAYVTKG